LWNVSSAARGEDVSGGARGPPLAGGSNVLLTKASTASPITIMVKKRSTAYPPIYPPKSDHKQGSKIKNSSFETLFHA
jgi:hypothetical protein